MTATIGDVLAGRYQLDAEIGRGGMGIVFRATDLKLDRQVAVKVMRTSVLDMPDAEARFRREAKVGATLEHSTVARTLDFGRDGDGLFLVTELLAGCSLLDFIRFRGTVPLDEARALGVQLADVLAFAHNRGVIHRDIKPENIVVENAACEPTARLLDFGMAFVDSIVDADPDKGRLTDAGLIGGTPAYLAPELARGERPSAASDVYALGATLFEIVCGTAPYHDPAVGKLLAMHLYAPIPRLRQKRPDAPRLLEEVITRMLDKNALSRPTAADVHERLVRLDEHATPIPERAADVLADGARADRMVSSAKEQVQAAGNGGVVAVRGELDDEIAMALASHGLVLVAVDEPADVLLALSRSLGELSEDVAIGLPVIADVSEGDVAQVSQRLRLGVADLVTRPARPHQVARKVLRALRRSKRRPNG